MLMLLSMHVTSVLFYYGSIISPWLWASNSSRPFLCALAGIYHFVAAEGSLSMFHKSYYYGWLRCSQNSRREAVIHDYHGHTLLLHTGGQESIQSHTSRKYLCNSEWGKWPHPPLITARLDVLAPRSQYFLPLEPVCFCWARPHILWGDCYLLVSCLEL